MSSGGGEPGGILPVVANTPPLKEEMEVRSVIQGIAVAHRLRYGYRRITAELRRRGMLVNHKRVARLMRDDNLLAVQPPALVVTTDSDQKSLTCDVLLEKTRAAWSVSS